MTMQTAEQLIQQATEILTTEPITEHLAKSVVTETVRLARGIGRHEALLGLKTASQAAEALGVKPTTIYRWCKVLGLGWQTGREIILTADEVETLRANVRPRQGRPRKGV
jgi:hypothetical protein